MELFALGILIGGLVILGASKLFRFKKSVSKEDTYLKTLKEFQSGFNDLELKYEDLTLQMEQMRDILKSHSYNDLLKAKDKLDTLVEEFRLEKRSNREISNRMFSDLYLLKENMKYIPKDENIY